MVLFPAYVTTPNRCYGAANTMSLTPFYHTSSPLRVLSVPSARYNNYRSPAADAMEIVDRKKLA